MCAMLCCVCVSSSIRFAPEEAAAAHSFAYYYNCAKPDRLFFKPITAATR